MKKYHDLSVTIELDGHDVEVAVSQFVIVPPDMYAIDSPADFWGYEEAEFTFKNGKFSEDYDVDCSDIHSLVVEACKEEVRYYVG